MKFEAVLEKHEAMDATGITIPFDIEKAFGKKRVPVKITINGAAYRSTTFFMDGRYVLVVPKVFRAAAGIKAGEKITVLLEKDAEKRTVEVPPELADALAKADLTDAFEKMSYTHRKELVNAVNDAKKSETRTRRIEKTILTVAEKFCKIIVCALLLNSLTACAKTVDANQRFFVYRGETVKIKDAGLEIRQLSIDTNETAEGSLIPLCVVELRLGNVAEEKKVPLNDAVDFKGFRVEAYKVFEDSCDLKVTRVN